MAKIVQLRTLPKHAHVPRSVLVRPVPSSIGIPPRPSETSDACGCFKAGFDQSLSSDGREGSFLSTVEGPADRTTFRFATYLEGFASMTSGVEPCVVVVYINEPCVADNETLKMHYSASASVQPTRQSLLATGIRCWGRSIS